MLDIKKIRENPDYFKKATADKQQDPNLVDEALRIDSQKKEVLAKVEELRAQRNKLGKEDIEKGKLVKVELGRLEKELEQLEKDLREILWKLPNPALANVPVGKDESQNVEIKKWGEIPKFDFPVKSHFELGETLDLIDTQRAGKVSGTRFGYLKNEGALLEFALLHFGFKTLVEKGFTPILPPVLIKKEVMKALGYNNKDWEETYILDKDNLCLVATAEHSMVPYFMEETLKEGDLPKRFVGYSPGFRKEAGSYGKDTKGILRVHQFDNLEMISFTKPEDSEKEHQFYIQIEEELMKALKIPYHLVQMCTGDLGDPAAAKFDVEAWFPSENKYRETHSCSNCTDYQARRLNIRFKRNAGETEFVHILNGTVFSNRPILAILENYQQKDGSVATPEVLKAYIGKDKVIPK